MDLYLIIAIIIAVIVIVALCFFIARLTAERDVQRTHAENNARQIDDLRQTYERQIADFIKVF